MKRFDYLMLLLCVFTLVLAITFIGNESFLAVRLMTAFIVEGIIWLCLHIYYRNNEKFD